MKTKEEILNEAFKNNGLKKGWVPESKLAVLQAMEEYAKQEALAFIVWYGKYDGSVRILSEAFDLYKQ